MARRFQLSSLFERPRAGKPPPYPTVRATLDAVRSGKKGLSLFSFPLASMTSGDPDYLALLRLAFERDLVVVLQNERIERLPFERQEPRVFVGRPEELWRIPAYMNAWRSAFAYGAWTFAAEAQTSALLGYTEKQIADWIARHREDSVAYGCETVLTLLDGEQRRNALSVAKRCFGPQPALEGLTVFVHHARELKKNAARLVPRGTTLARVGLSRATTRILFGDRRQKRRGLFTATIAGDLAATVNDGIRTNVQFLTSRGWR